MPLCQQYGQLVYSVYAFYIQLWIAFCKTFQLRQFQWFLKIKSIL